MKMLEKIKRSELVFLVAWAIFTCTIIVGVTFFKFQDGYAPIENAVKWIRLGSYGLCVVLLLIKDYKRSNIMNVVVIAGIIMLSVLMSNNTVNIWCVLFMAAAIGFDADKINVVSVISRFLMIVVTIGLTKVGILTDYIFSATTRARHGLGFDWATTGPIIFFFLALSYIYFRREKLNFVELALIEIGHIYFYEMTDTRMTFYIGTASVLFFAINILIKRKWYWSKRVGYLLCLVPVVVGVAAILLHVLYDETNAIWSALNGIMSGRLKLGYDAFHTYGLTLFGQEIEWVGFGLNESSTGYNYVDCSYLQYMLEYGVVFLALVLGIYTVLIYRGIKKNDYFLVWICLITLVFCITEPWLFNFTFNPIPVLVLAQIRDRNEESGGNVNEQECENYYSNT